MSTWEEAFKKAVKVYWEEGDSNMETHKLKPPKYDKKYFDNFEKERFGDKVKKVIPDATNQE